MRGNAQKVLVRLNVPSSKKETQETQAATPQKNFFLCKSASVFATMIFLFIVTTHKSPIKVFHPYRTFNSKMLGLYAS